jgi:hypothetical protein
MRRIACLKLRSITLALAGAVLTTGLASSPAQAGTAQAGQPATARPASEGAQARAVAALAGIGSAGGGQAGAVTHAGVITGFVRGTGGAPLAGACVVASGPAGSAMAMTQPDGRYIIASVRPGTYTLHVSDCSAPGRYLDQGSGPGSWPATAPTVTVTAGHVSDVAQVTLRSTASVIAHGVGVAASLGLGAAASAELGTGAAAVPGVAAAALPARAGSSAILAGTGAFSGKVVGRGKPLQDICVTSYPSSGRGSVVRTSASGRYRVGGLRPGHYFVHFSACAQKSNWLPQWYRGLTAPYLRHRPARVTVTAGKTTRGIDASMRLGGEIDGTVRSKSGQALAGICVVALGRSGRRIVYGREFRSDASGHYAAHGLFPADYQVAFFRGCGNNGNYAPSWWRNAPTMARATKITVTFGQVVTKIDASMPTGAEITGVVRGGSATGRRLAGICVFARSRSAGFGSAFSVTGRNGSYKLVGLTTGKYEIEYLRCRNHGNYLPARRSVKVTVGGTVSGFNTVLALGAVVSGVVKDGQGNPVSGICVEVSGRHQFGGKRTGSDGSYSINALPTGSYTVGFSGGCGNTGSYAPQYYNGQPNQGSANPVQLTAGQTTTGIDATMQPGATITGVVTDTGGNKLSNVCVSVSPVSDQRFGFFFGRVAFTKNGSYTVQNLTPGLYAVSFECFGSATLAQQWFLSQSAAGHANLVSAPPGAITSGISATLQPAGSIAGVVTNRRGQPLRGICVAATQPGTSGPVVFGGAGGAITGKTGAYLVRGLGAGSYDVHFSECGRGGYGSRWYHQKPTAQSATPVTVTAGSTTTGISEVLAPGGSISGRVISSAGTPVAGACVEAADAATNSFGFRVTDRTGRYSIPALSTGSYQVSFYSCRTQTLASSTRPAPVLVTAPQAVTGVNARLGIAGSISGTVRGTAAATPQENACIIAVPADPHDSYAVSQSGKGGTYQIGGLGAGQYKVYFGDPFCPFAGTNYAPQWFKGQPTQATATSVTVSAGAVTTAIGAKLALDGGISGTVTDSAHNPVAGECVTASPVSATPDPLFGDTLQPVIGVSGSDGSYSLVDLLPGKYTVEFSTGCGDSGFTTQWWNDAASQSSASAVSVSATATVTGIDATLQH